MKDCEKNNIQTAVIIITQQYIIFTKHQEKQ